MIIDNSTPISKNPTEIEIQKLLEDIQGNILKSHARQLVRLVSLQFQNDIESVKKWIETEIATKITSMSEQLEDAENHKKEIEQNKPVFMSFSLSHQGYLMLGLDAGSFLTDQSFISGMKSGTIPDDPPVGQWQQEYQNDIHAFLIIASSDEPTQNEGLKRLEDFLADLTNNMPESVQILAEQDGRALRSNGVDIEHFGFADGRSQPRFFNEDMVEHEKSTDVWDPFASLNLVLTKDPFGRAFIGGFTGQGSMPTDDDRGDHSFGSYLVFRKLEQDVDGWNNQVIEIARQTGISEDLVGAYAVGRFKDGTPVVNHSSSTGVKPIENDFDFSQDPQGNKCPFHSHIRKTNPRGETKIHGATLEEEKRRRITRRGIPYNDNGKKGLLFMCYQSDILRQFDFMQNIWADNERFLNEDTGIDSVIGQGASGPKKWPQSHGGSDTHILPFGKFVRMKGGEYFFTPSISSLRNISKI